MAVLAAYGFAALWTSRGRWARGAGVAAALLVAFEFWPAPIQMAVLPPVPTFYEQLAAEPYPTPVLDVPANWRWRADPYLLNQMTHGQPIFAGHLSRDYPYPLLETPFFREIGWIGYFSDIVDQDVPRIAGSVLSHYGFRYVVFHKNLLAELPAGPAPAAAPLLASAAQFGEPVYEDELIAAFRVRTVAEPQPFFEIGDGWYPREAADGHAMRWLRDRAALRIVNARERPVKLRFEATAFARNRAIAMLLDGTEIARWSVDTRWTPLAVDLQLPGQISVVELRAIEPPDSPAALGVSADARPLSVAVRSVRLQLTP